MSPEENVDSVARYLRRHGHISIGCRDTRLLHEVADELGMKHIGGLTEKTVLDYIDRYNKGAFVKRYKRYPERGCGKLRVFFLPEHCKD